MYVATYPQIWRMLNVFLYTTWIQCAHGLCYGYSWTNANCFCCYLAVDLMTSTDHSSNCSLSCARSAARFDSSSPSLSVSSSFLDVAESDRAAGLIGVVDRMFRCRFDSLSFLERFSFFFFFDGECELESFCCRAAPMLGV